MNFTQRDVQQNIQAQLPVIPNNGNPAGAHNMPQQATQQPAAPANPYAWLDPSPAMASVRSLLDAYQPQTPAAPMMQPQVPTQGMPPTLPMMNPQQPVMPANMPVLPAGF